MKTIWIAGATGLVGQSLVQRLSTSTAHTVVAFVRKRSALQGPAQVVVDFDHLENADVGSLRPDEAFCALGTTRKVAGSDEAFRRVDLDYVVAFAKRAKAAGAHKFVLISSLGADASSSMLYARTKGEAEEAVRALGFATVVVVRPSVLDGDRKESRPGEAVALAIGRVIAPLMLGPLRKYRPSPVDEVARAAIVALRESEKDGRSFRICEAEELPSLARNYHH